MHDLRQDQSQVHDDAGITCQKRQEVKDRLRSQHDYRVDLKAELEIRRLHDKIDHLLSHQWERLVEIQKIQIDLLSELARLRTKDKTP